MQTGSIDRPRLSKAQLSVKKREMSVVRVLVAAVVVTAFAVVGAVEHAAAFETASLRHTDTGHCDRAFR